MDIPYQPFSGESSCPKCGDGLSVEYQSPGTAFVGGFDGGVVCAYRRGAPEWLLRECLCGYARAEMCVDAFPHTALG